MRYWVPTALLLVTSSNVSCTDDSDNGSELSADGALRDADIPAAPDAASPRDGGEEPRDSGVDAASDASRARGDAGADGSATVPDAAPREASVPDAAPREASVPDAASPLLIDNPLSAFPQFFSEVGLYPNAGDFETVEPRALHYEPKHALWSNGGRKQRYLLLPQGARVDTGERWSWEFPVGTLLFKTFFFAATTGGAERAVETRILRRGEEEWEYAAYVWAEAGTEAELSPMTQAIGADVAGPEGESVLHLIPSRRQCVRCHEAGLSFVLGFSELQLNFAPNGEGNTLDRLDARGVFAEPLPSERLEVRHEDELTERVVGYLQGNCVHCHNGQSTELNAFDMRPDVALDNLIGQPTSSSASASGIRIVPGDPAASVVFQAFSGETDDPEVEFMPNVGVQLRDAAAIEMMREWVTQLSIDSD